MKIIFKHSSICPISRMAKMEMDAFLKSNTREFEYELIVVQENRQRSNEVEEKYGVQHESPQCIILDDGDNVTWHASHHSITKKSIEEAVS